MNPAAILQIIGDLSVVLLLVIFSWLLLSGRLMSRDAVDRMLADKDAQIAHEREMREQCEHDRMRNGRTP